MPLLLFTAHVPVDEKCVTLYVLTTRLWIDACTFRESPHRITSITFDIPAGKDDIALVMRRRPRTLPDQSLYSPPSQESVNPIVSRLRWESEMWEKFWSTSVYILVTTLILIIVYGQKEPMSILLTTNANNMFVASTFTDGQKFYEVSITVSL